MTTRHVIIKLTPDKIFFNENISIDIFHSNLPEQLKLLKFECVYWKLIQSAFDHSSGKLSAEVADYFPRIEDIAPFASQNPKYQIKLLFLSNLRDSATVTAAVKYYDKQVIRLLQEDNWTYDIGERENISTAPDLLPPIPLREQTIQKQFEVNFRDAVFKTGYVFFEEFVEEAGKPVVFQIPNEYILAEYEYIKSYFQKALKSKKFKVYATVKLYGHDVLDVSARSPHIDLIDPQLIDSIKISRTLALTRTPFYKEPDKSLFTSDEIFDTFESEDIEGNIFNQNEQDILTFLIDIKKVRNRKQLEYLAGKKQSTVEKLRFTLNPHFGFLFLLEGESMNHFCWELLNSHATYIWSIEKSTMSVEMQYKRIEMVINSIRNIGRERYKSSYRNSHLDEDLVFCAITHKDASSDFVDGFVRWKHKLNEKIV
jgi:hypothetical protein